MKRKGGREETGARGRVELTRDRERNTPGTAPWALAGEEREGASRCGLQWQTYSARLTADSDAGPRVRVADHSPRGTSRQEGGQRPPRFECLSPASGTLRSIDRPQFNAGFARRARSGISGTLHILSARKRFVPSMAQGETVRPSGTAIEKSLQTSPQDWKCLCAVQARLRYRDIGRIGSRSIALLCSVPITSK